VCVCERVDRVAGYTRGQSRQLFSRREMSYKDRIMRVSRVSKACKINSRYSGFSMDSDGRRLRKVGREQKSKRLFSR
jgi:hypothetical protein